MSVKPKDRIAIFTPRFITDLEFWVSTDRKLALRILKLIEAVTRDPFEGIGKPEALKHTDGAFWSRRINDEHRLVYEIFDDRIEFYEARFHY
jgi:toxin YoeB